MVLVEDRWSVDDSLNVKENFFSGIGDKKSIDFDSTEFVGNECTKWKHPINSRRYRVLGSKRILLAPKFDGHKPSVVNTKYWNMNNKKVTLRTISTVGQVKASPNLKVAWWYESGDNGNGNEEMKAEFRVYTFFKG
jgi:hypothetical protein